MRRVLGPLLVLLLAGAVVRVVMSGQYVDFVRPAMGLPLLATAALLLAVGGIGWFLATGRPARDDTEAHTHGHGGGLARLPVVTWLLAVPALVLLASPPPPLGADAVLRQSTAQLAVDHQLFAPLPAEDPVELDAREAVERAAYEPRSGIYGRLVTIEGFAVPTGSGEWSLARIAVSCCAADGVAWSLPVDGAASPEEDAWVRVTGRLVPGRQLDSGLVVPSLDADQVVPVQRPERPYLTTRST